MRPTGICCLSIMFLSAMTLSTQAADTMNPAHTLAQKFAEQETPKPAAKPQPAPAPAFKVAPKPGSDYEKEMLEAARAEAEARKPAQPTAPAASPAAPPPPAAAAAPPAPPAAAPVVPTAAPAAAPAPVQQAATKPPETAPPRAPAVVAGAPAHVTMLLVLTSSAATGTPGKIQSNPIVCSGDDCFISAGSSSAATVMPKAQAMDAKNSALGLPGACQGTTSCVFRDVTLRPGASLQVVDAGFARAEPFAAIDVHPDASCAIHEDDLDCEDPVSAKDYRLWLVPEQVAQKASAAQIDDALSTGLVEENITRADDK